MKPSKKNGPDASEPRQIEAAVLTLEKLRAHAGTLAQVHAMLAPEAVVADGTTQLVPADINAVLLARQFIQALHADLIDALTAAEQGESATTAQTNGAAGDQPQPLD